jgi:hypothetical protein
VIIVGLTGYAFSGKSTVASELSRIIERDYGLRCTRSAFGDALKDLARREFGWDGKKDERGRRLLQILATEAGRHYDPDIWVNKFLDNLRYINEDFSVVIVDDVRYPNEASAIKNSRGFIVRVTASFDVRSARAFGLGASAGVTSHESEAHADSLYADYVYDNDRDVIDEKQIEAIVRGVFSTANLEGGSKS